MNTDLWHCCIYKGVVTSLLNLVYMRYTKQIIRANCNITLSTHTGSQLTTATKLYSGEVRIGEHHQNCIHEDQRAQQRSE